MVTASTSQITTVGASFSGPLPPPSLLAKYNEAVPNGAERVMAMAERQGTHREHLEKCVVEGNVQAQKLGSVFGFIVAMTAVVGGIYLISIGKSTAGLVAVIGSLASLVGVFIYGKHQQAKERSQKSQTLDARRVR
jgi:uncharacterized membrane protein